MKLAIGFVLSFLITTAAWAEDTSGVFMVVKGDVKITSGKDGKTDAAKVGKKVFAGDSISAGADSRAKIVMSDKNILNISPDSKIKIETYSNDPKSDSRNVELKIEYGKVRATVEQKYDGEKNKFNIKTPTAVAGVRGTDFLTGFNRSTRQSSIVTFTGTVAVGTPGPRGEIQNPVFVRPGQQTSVGASGAPEAPKPMPKEELQKMNNETSADLSRNDNKGSQENAGRDNAQNDDKKEEAKKDEPRKDEAKRDEPKPDEPKKDEPRKEEAKRDEPKKDEARKEEARRDEPKNEPRKDEAKRDDPKQEPRNADARREDPKNDPRNNQPGNQGPQTADPNQSASGPNGPAQGPNPGPATAAAPGSAGPNGPAPAAGAPGSTAMPGPGMPSPGMPAAGMGPNPGGDRSPASMMPPGGMMPIAGPAMPSMINAGDLGPDLSRNIIIGPNMTMPTQIVRPPTYVPPATNTFINEVIRGGNVKTTIIINK